MHALLDLTLPEREGEGWLRFLFLKATKRQNSLGDKQAIFGFGCGFIAELLAR